MAKPLEILKQDMPWLLAVSCVLGIVSAILTIRNAIISERERKAAKSPV